MANKIDTVAAIETLEINLRAINNCIRLKKGELKEKIERIRYDCPSEYESISILCNSIVCLLKQEEMLEFSLSLLRNRNSIASKEACELLEDDELKRLISRVSIGHE